MKLRFSKMHGLGNDFMVIDGINQALTLSQQQIAGWADRHFGIGFDQLLLVESASSSAAMFKYRIFNADGSEVSQCGNGARCFARFVRDKGLTDAMVIPVETHAGLLELKMLDNGQVEVNMGVPLFEPAEIPLDAAQRSELYRLTIDDQQIEFSALSMGNPHAVILVDDVDNAAVQNLGPRLESHPMFPQRANIGFLQIVDPASFKLRVFERGVGETLACGSGACAAMVAGVMRGKLNHHASAQLLGGELQLDWPGEGQPVMMSGDTALVYEGEIDI
ncbi:MAG: diaminopimelate epimerase [Gammaproteobacteria bacterium]|nr:diaminopimelate epimerase [Gammaproteobacteria bacterium]